MPNRIRASWCVIAALWAVCCFSTTAQASPFLSAEIEHALTARSEFLQTVGLTDTDFLTLSSWLAANDGEQFAANIAVQRGSGNPWYFYISGLIAEDGADFYNNALWAAESDPGALWLLGLEFIRYKQFQWAVNAFTILEKWILTNGGSSAPFLAKQLLLVGDALSTQSLESANFCYSWAKRFDENQCWWLYQKAMLDFPRNVFGTIPKLAGNAANILVNSWRAQIALIRGAYRLVSATVFIFIFSVLAVFAVKYLASGVHAIGDALFFSASPRYRTVSSVIIILSTFILGPFVAFWIVAFLVCEFLSDAEKKLLVFVCTLLALSPLDPYVTTFLARPDSPVSPTLLLDRAINEGYSNGLHELIAENVKKAPNNYVNSLALAVSASKSGEHRNLAEEAVGRAYQAASNDPLVLLYAGNISFLANDHEAMVQRYGELLKKYPKSAEGMFNLAMAHVNNAGFTATDMIGEAAKINPASVGEFMRENKRYFEESDPPPLRKIMQPALSAGYFWKYHSLAGFMEFFDMDHLKNKLSSIIIFAALYVGFLALYFTVWTNKAKFKKYFMCRVCGRILCKKCRKGTMCSICYKEFSDNHNNAAAMHNLQNKHLRNSLVVGDYKKFALGILCPGAETLYAGEQVSRGAVAVGVTSFIYAAFYCAFTFTTNYPSRVVIYPVYYVMILGFYNMAAVIRQSLWLMEMLRIRAKMAVKQV